MKKVSALLSVWLIWLLAGCSPSEQVNSIEALVADSPSIAGKAEYLDSPFVTAGDRLYMVGHQDGSFPEVGWHIKGEMGGIWNHPIKLMDGLDVKLAINERTYPLEQASSFVNYPFANSHTYLLDGPGLKVERWQFVPDNTEGIVLQYSLLNSGDSEIDITFKFTAHTDLRPTWLGEQSGMYDSQDEAEFIEDDGIWLVKDQDNPWFVAFGSNNMPAAHSAEDNPYLGMGVSNSLSYPITIQPDATAYINFTIAGSYTSREEALESYKNVQGSWDNALLAKKQRYKEIAEKSKLTVPDKQLEQTFEWLKYNCDWLIQTVPEIGTGITAGIPDYPWWFGVDSEYALKGYMAVGQKEVVHSTIALLDSVSMAVNGNGRILHEMSTNGVVFNKGNINETPQFASLIWEIYQWNGDRAFLERYFPTVKMGLEWLMKENDRNGNLFPDGFGMMEIHGLDSEMIDVAAYTQKAFSDASKMASQLGDNKLAKVYETMANQLKDKINKEFWSPAFNSYADFLGTDTQALQLIEDAIIRADTLNKPWAVAELRETAATIKRNPSSELRPFVVHHNWVVNTPMEMQIADNSKALKALETAEKFVNPFGVFVTGIDRDESAGADEGSFVGSKVFSYTGAVMTLPTGVQAVAENNYGRPDKALEYLQRMCRSFSYALPGSMYEVSPDYGMMAQAWNIYSFAIPIVKQFFGIRPRAFDKRVVIKPQFPTLWDSASLENVEVGENSISVSYVRKEGICTLSVQQSHSNWTMQVVLPANEERKYRVLEGEFTEESVGKQRGFSTTANSLIIQWKQQ